MSLLRAENRGGRRPSFSALRPCVLRASRSWLFHDHRMATDVPRDASAYDVSEWVKSLSRVRLCDPMDRSTPGLPVHPQLPGLAQTHVHQVGDAIPPSHPLLRPSPQGIHVKATFSVRSTFFFPCCIYQSVLHVCVSLPALQIGSSVPFF